MQSLASEKTEKIRIIEDVSKDLSTANAQLEELQLINEKLQESIEQLEAEKANLQQDFECSTQRGSTELRRAHEEIRTLKREAEVLAAQSAERSNAIQSSQHVIQS